MALLQSDCPDLDLVARGKVRDIYKVSEEHLLFVSTDRISAFDVIMRNGVPGKGKILTQMSVFWFEMLEDIIGNHYVTCDIDKMPESVKKYRDQLEGRCMLVNKFNILPVEAIVRGYITGSGWNEYQKKGTVCDIQLPKGLKECQQLSEPLFTPSTKAELGKHDENIHPDKVKEIIGEIKAKQMEKAAINFEYGKLRGIIIADTKFEFGVDVNGQMYLVDEVLTPDSSRFWPAEKYAMGRGQESYDKQYVRDYLLGINFDKKNPVELPESVIEGTREKYLEIYRILTGKEPKL